MRFLGIDLHYDSFVVAYLVDKHIIKVEKIIFHTKEFQWFLDSLTQNDYIAIEASTNSFWFYDQVYSRVKECYIINPGRFALIGTSKKKTDKIDAKKIARKLRYKVLELVDRDDDDEFPTIYIPAKKVQYLRSLFTTYELLQGHKIAAKNRIFSLVVSQGYYIKGSTLHNKKYREATLNLSMDESVRFQIELLYAEIDMKEQQLSKIKEKILILGLYFEKEIKRLIEIKGTSIFSAIAIMTDIATVERFKTAKKMCSYLRSAPSIDSSNKSEKIGRVNKQSRGLALKMLLQGLTHVYKSSPYLKQFYLRKSKGKGKGKIRIAIARKIFSAIYQMLKHDKPYYWKDNEGAQKKKNEYEKFLKKTA